MIGTRARVLGYTGYVLSFTLFAVAILTSGFSNRDEMIYLGILLIVYGAVGALAESP